MMYDITNSLEIQRLYSFVTSQNVKSIAFSACNSGEGVSALALGLTQRHLLSGYNTLLVDLNLYNPGLTPLLNTHDDSANNRFFPAPQLMACKQSSIALTGISATLNRNQLVKLRSPGQLKHAIAQWQTEFDLVIVDTSPLNRINANNIPAELAAAACDAAILVILAGQTSKAQISEGKARLDAANANLIGSVLNDQCNPSLKTELLRETGRLKKYSTWLEKQCRKLISQNQLLTLDL